VTVTLSNGSVITIEAGKTTGTVTVPAPPMTSTKTPAK
jgi:surface adhesion protein